jgi:hypothetical protein
MTGNVPYYGGRLGPAQAYAASHSAQVATEAQPQAPQAAPSGPKAGDLTEKLTTLQQLLDDGLLTQEEFDTLRQRALQ